MKGGSILVMKDPPSATFSSLYGWTYSKVGLREFDVTIV